MYLITSAAFIASELQSEFGPLPPSFLPVGNQRLFHHQLALIPDDKHTILTLPEGFQPGPYDARVLADKKIEILYLPTHLSLGESIVYSLNLIEFNPKEPLFILHGDTLVDKLPIKSDLLGLSHIEDNYDWAEYDLTTGLLHRNKTDRSPSDNLVANGFFSFSAPKTLIRHITMAKWNFIEGLNGYQQEIGLTPFEFKHWYDFGHSHTYYQSKKLITTQRAFNKMTISKQVVTKTSHKKFKLIAEANWYDTIPRPLRSYTPQLLGTQDSPNSFSYSIEYLHLTALNELFIFGQLPAFSWQKILKACCQFIQQTKLNKVDNKFTLNALFASKTRERLHEYNNSSSLAVSEVITMNGKPQPSLEQLSEISLKYLPEDTGQINIWHGDFCFSNILYDFRTCNIKVIDPRGINTANKQDIYGNSAYDIAKLAHSVIGLYDAIIAGYFVAEQQGQQLTFEISISPRQEKIISSFIEIIKQEFNITTNQLYAMQIQLFLSMLPLHSDRQDRQLGFIGNAYRLFEKINSHTGNTQ